MTLSTTEYIESFQVPSDIQVEKNTPNQLRIRLEPFERGFGHTVGNALRRILLSSMNGAAVVSVSIDGVNHEYDSMEGVAQDVIEIILNLKELAIKLHSGTQATLSLDIDADAPRDITAADFRVEGNAEIINPEHVIATLTTPRSFKMVANIENGVGYQSVEQRKENGEVPEHGFIMMDASFSPVDRVVYQVENARVENRTDLDAIVLDVSTNGTLDAKDSIKKAASILQVQLGIFSDIDLDAFKKQRQDEQVTCDPVMLQSIESLELTVRALNCLRSEKVHLVGDLVTKTDQDLMKIPNLGRKSMTEIKTSLATNGLSLGMKVEPWPPKHLATSEDAE